MTPEAHVTIVTPCFNRADLIPETLDSVLAQTDGRWVCIVVDDGSTDAAPDVVQTYVERDARFRLLRRDREPKGANTCRNIGLEAARSEFVVFLDSDDLLTPDRVASTLELGEAHPDLDALIFQCKLIDSAAKVYFNRFGDPADDLARFLVLDHPWTTGSPSWRTRFLQESLKGWDVSLPRWQDWELGIRALAQGMRYRCVDDRVGYLIRAHHGASISNASDRGQYVWAEAVFALDAVMRTLRRTGWLRDVTVRRALECGVRDLAARLQQTGHPWQALALLRRMARLCRPCLWAALLATIEVVLRSVADKMLIIERKRRPPRLMEIIDRRAAFKSSSAGPSSGSREPRS